MAWRIMIVVEDMDYEPDERPGHLADAGWYGWVGGPGDVEPKEFDDYEAALAQAEALSVAS